MWIDIGVTSSYLRYRYPTVLWRAAALEVGRLSERWYGMKAIVDSPGTVRRRPAPSGSGSPLCRSRRCHSYSTVHRTKSSNEQMLRYEQQTFRSNDVELGTGIVITLFRLIHVKASLMNILAQFINRLSKLKATWAPCVEVERKRTRRLTGPRHRTTS